MRVAHVAPTSADHAYAKRRKNLRNCCVNYEKNFNRRARGGPSSIGDNAALCRISADTGAVPRKI